MTQSLFASPEIITFSRHLHHMLATPVTTLLCSVETLQSSSDLRTIKKTVSHLAAASERLQQTLRQLQFQNSGSEHFSPLTICKALLPLFESQNNFCTVLNSPATLELSFTGNRFLFEEVLICLINNALESYQDEEKKMVIISLYTEKNTLLCSVRDFGKGISWWQLPLITLPSLSFKKQHSGIGLAFVKKVVQEEWLGKLEIQRHQYGTSITIQLPLPPTSTQSHGLFE